MNFKKKNNKEIKKFKCPPIRRSSRKKLKFQAKKPEEDEVKEELNIENLSLLDPMFKFRK